MSCGSAVTLCGTAIGMGCARVDGVVATTAEEVVVPLDVRPTDAVAVVLTKLDVRGIVVVDVVLEDVRSVVVVVGVELPVVVTTESVVVTTESVVVAKGCVVVAVVVSVIGSATAVTTPPESAVSVIATPNAAAPRQEPIGNGDALIVAQLLSFHLQQRPNVSLFSNTRVPVSTHITCPMVTRRTAFSVDFAAAHRYPDPVFVSSGSRMNDAGLDNFCCGLKELQTPQLEQLPSLGYEHAGIINASIQ